MAWCAEVAAKQRTNAVVSNSDVAGVDLGQESGD